MVGRGLVSANDPGLYRIADDVEQAAAEVERFYRLCHSQRDVRDSLGLRLPHPLSEAVVADLNVQSRDILSAPATQAPGPVAGEGDELPDLPRLVVPFNRCCDCSPSLLLD